MSNLTLPDRPARRSKAIIRNGPCHLYQVIARARLQHASAQGHLFNA